MPQLKSIFQRHSFFSNLKSEEHKTMVQDNSLLDIIDTRKNPILKRDRLVTERVKPHMQAISIQAKNNSNGKLANPDEICLSESEIKASSLLHTVDKEQLKSQFKEAVKSFPNAKKSQVMLQTIANFMGGGLITGGNKDKALDGFLPETNFEIWQWLLDTVDAHLEPEEKEAFEKIKAGIEKLKKSAHFFSEMYHQPLTPEESTKKIHAESLEYAKKIQNLKPGESEVFSGGWTNLGGAGGHAQIYEIERRSDGLLNVLVYTSTGFALTEYFLGGVKNRLKPVIRYEKVPDKVLFFGEKDQISPMFIQGLMEVNIMAAKNPNLELGEKHILGVLKFLGSYRVSVPIVEAGVITGQRAGTCSPSVTKQFMRFHSGSGALHKKVMFHTELKLLTAFYCSVVEKLTNKGPIAEKSRRALVQDARKLLKISIKLNAQGLLKPELFAQARATAHDILNRVESAEAEIAATRKTKVFKSAWKKATCDPQRAERVKHNPKAKCELPSTVARRTPQPNLSIKIDLQNNCAQSLAKAFRETFDRCSSFETYTLCGKRCRSAQVAHLVDQLPLPGTPEAEAFWNQFTIGELKTAQKNLFILTKEMAKSRPYDDLLERRFATVMPLQVLTHFLAVKIDDFLIPHRGDDPKANLINYKIPSYVDVLQIEGLQFFDREQFNRLVQASNYFKLHNQKATLGTLFVSEIGAKSVENEKIVTEKDVELTNGYYWKALLDAHPALKKEVSEKANEKWPDFTEEKIRELHAAMEKRYADWKLEMEEWKANPVGPKPNAPPVPTPIHNLPEQTKHTLIMDSVGLGPGNDFLESHGYGHITYFRAMNSIANGWFYDSNYPDFLSRRGFAIQGNPSTARLENLVSTQDKPSQNILDLAVNNTRELNNEHKEFLKNPLCQRDLKNWQQATAEGKVLNKDKKDSFLDKFLRPLSQWEIAPEQLVYELEKEWFARNDVDLLEDASFQGLFFRLFFRSPVMENRSIELGLGNLIVKNAALREALVAFINKGFARIQTKKMSFNTARFFFELSFHAAKYLADAGLHEEAEKFSQLATIKNYFDNPKELTPDQETTLHLYQVLFYSVKKDLTVEEQASLFASWSLHQIFPKVDSKFKATGIYHFAFEFILYQIEKISHLPCQELGKLVAEKVKILPLVENAQWGVDAGLGFPYITDGTSKINLMTGGMLRPEGPVLGVPKDFHWENEVGFKRLFKGVSNVRYEALGSDCIGFTLPHKGAFRLIKEDGAYLIQRMMAGRWYQYKFVSAGPLQGQNADEDLLLGMMLKINGLQAEKKAEISPYPNALVYDHAYWIPVIENDPNADWILGKQNDPQVKGIFTDLKDLKPLYQHNENGTIVELKPEGLTVDYLHADEKELAGFSNFDKSENILTFRKGDALQKVSFPAFYSLDGNPLAFDCQDQKLLWTENREYEISSTMQKGALGPFKNYLFLNSTKDPKRAKIFVPLKPIAEADTPTTTCQLEDVKYPAEPKDSPNGNEFASTLSFITLDYIDGEVKATNMESRCYLAYIYLAQKKYEEAAEILKGIKATEEVTKTAEFILNLIQNLPVGEDHPDAKMVRLHATSLLLTRAEKKSLEPIVEFFGPTELGKLIKDVSSVLQNSNSISAACHLSKDSEIQLLNRLIREGYALKEKLEANNKKCSFSVVDLDQLNQRLMILQKKAIDSKLKSYPSTSKEKEMKLSSDSFVSYGSKCLIQSTNPYREKEKDFEIQRQAQWINEGLKQFDPNEQRIHSTIRPASYYQNGRLFLEVYSIAKGSSPVLREQMLHRLSLWKEFATEESHFLDVLLMIAMYPDSFPKLIQKENSDLEIVEFLIEVDRVYAVKKSFGLPKAHKENKAETHDPVTPTKYPVSIDQTLEKTIKPLSEIVPDKVQLKVKFDAQTDRWQQMKVWEGLLTEDKEVNLQKGNDFQFSPENILKPHEENYTESLKRDFEILSQDYEKGKEQNLAAKSKKLSKENCAKIKAEAQDQIKSLAAKRGDLEVKLLAMANQHSAVELAKLGGKVDSWMQFQDCVDCLLSFDARSYIQKNENLTTAEINEIANMTLLILDLKSHEAQLKRIVKLSDDIHSYADGADQASYRSFCQQIESELSNRYHFEEGFSAEEQAVMRIFAGQGGIIPFKKQIDLIKKMLKADPANPSNFQDIVIQLIMGGGKTSVIAMLMLMLAAKRKGRLAFFIVPASQHKTVMANLGEGALKAFNKELLSVDLEREQFSIFRLQDTLAVLNQAENGQQPVIVSAATLQGLELELLSVSRQIKDVLKKREIEIKKNPNNEDEKKAVQDEIKNFNDALLQLRQKAEGLNDILRNTESKADSLIDEVDLILDSLQELNFIDGAKISINTVRSGLLLNIYKSLLNKGLKIKTLPGEPSVDDVSRLWDLQRPHMDPKDFLLHVVPVLAQHLAESYKPFIQGIPNTLKNTYIRYASGVIPAHLEKCMHERIELTDEYVKEHMPKHNIEDLKNDLEFLKYLHGLKNSTKTKNKDLGDLIAISKHFLTELTPACLEKEGGRDFGVDTKNPGKIIPYVGVLAPAQTEFGYHWENVAYHYQYGAAFKPDKEMILSLATLWTSTARHFVSEDGEKFEETPEYISFFKIFGVALDKIKDEGVIEKAIENVFKDREKCLELQFELANRFAGYASERLTSNGFALCDLLASRLSMSGTPWNAEGYSKKLAQRIIQDIGTEGRILHKLAERATPDKILEVDQPANIQEFLQQTYAQYAAKGKSFKKVRGIIEAGGIFKGFGNNSTIAKGWLDFIVQKQTEEKDLVEKTVDPALEAVLFFGADEGQTQQNTLYVWRKGAEKPERIGGSTLENLKAKGLDPSKYVVFIDEVHGTGTDIPQAVDALNIVTFDDMITRKATQNIMRLRKFLSEQDVDFVMSKETRASLHNQGKTVQDLFLNAAKKQSITKTESMVRYFTQQIHHIFRKHAIQIVRGLIDKKAMDDIEFAKCVENAEKFFVSYMEELPFLQHGRLVDEVDTKEMLIKILNNKHKLFKDAIQIPEVLANVQKEVEELGAWIQDSKVLPAKWKDINGAIGIEQEIEQKVQLQQKAEIKVEIEIEIQNELMQYTKNKVLSIRPEIEMSMDRFQSLLQGMKKPEQSHDLISLKKQLSAYEYKFNGKCFPYQNCFEEPIFGTKAYFNTTTDVASVLPIFHPTQRPPKQILAVRHEGQISWLMLSEHEARDAALHLDTLYKDGTKTTEAWLLQLDGTAFVKNPESFPLNDMPAAKGLMELNFLAGHLTYLDARPNREEFAEWLEKEPELKVRFLKLRALQDPIQKQHLFKCEPIAVLSNNGVLKKDDEFDKLMCKARRKKMKEFKGTLSLDTPEKGKLLHQRQVGKLKVAQVPLLGIDVNATDPVTVNALNQLAQAQKLEGAEAIAAAAKAHTEKQFSALQAYQVPYLTPEQMQWLPKSKVRYILEPEQIYQDVTIDGTNVRKYLLSKEQVEGLKVDQQDLIPFVDPQFYAQFDQNWQIAAVPFEHLDRIDPSQANKITLEQIRQLTPAVMANMQDFLKGMTNDQLKLIDPKYIDHIPEERSKDLASSQIDGFGSNGYNQLPDGHKLWQVITPKAVSFLSKDKISNIAKEKYCHIKDRNVVGSLSKFDFVHLDRRQLATRKSSFIIYFLGILTLGVAACVVSAVAYVTVPFVWLVNREKGRKFNAALSLNFKRVGHLFGTYVPALFTSSDSLNAATA